MNPLDYVARGWAIFPVHSVKAGKCTCGKDPCGNGNGNAGKHPRTLHGVKDATKDPATVQRWVQMFGHDVNWAVACGEVSGVVVMDVDPRNGGDRSLEAWTAENGDVPVTLTTLTGGSGFHYFFRYPHDGGPVTNRPNFMPGVDFKSDGGYVLLPPSRHASGNQYTFRDQRAEVVPIPDQLLLTVRNSTTEAKKIDTRNLTKIESGSRNDTLFRLACRLRRQLFDDRLSVEASVRAYNMFTCDPPLEESEVAKIIDSAFKQDHADDFSQVAKALAEQAGIRHLTDDGNAHRLIDYHGADLLYVSTWGWVRWSGRSWVPDGEGLSVQDRARLVHEDIRREVDRTDDQEFQAAILKWAGKSESSERIGAMIKLARSDNRANRSHTAFDVEPNLLSCRNGVLDLDTGELRDHRPDDFITRCTNVDYDPAATCPEWDAFVLHACDGDADLVDYVQRAVGYSLSGDTSQECFFLIVGPAAAGKSTFVSAVQAAVGEYAGTLASDTILIRGQQPRRESDLAGSIGKRFMSVVEMPEGERLDESVVKQMTGGDNITARFLYKNPFSFKPQFKLWIATNHEPRINDEAIWRRVKRIPFPRGLGPGERDPRVKAVISNPEVGGRAVLAWGVRGYAEYRRRALAEPARVLADTEAYHLRQDRIGQFLEQSTLPDEQGRVTAGEMYARYCGWCAMTGERAASMSGFMSRLDGRPEVTVIKLDSHQWVGGVRLKSNVGAGASTEGGSAWNL